MERQKLFIIATQVMNLGCRRMAPKLNNSHWNEDDLNPTKVIRAKSTLKEMFACFLGINGHVVTVILENCKMVNSEWYTIICLPEVFEEIRENWKFRRFIRRAVSIWDSTISI
ncbi:hypothetical protein EVAR_77805_1 [Eumeta japonica]|uniref:Uncharacterized protein n=1 Tax=Eumeta variegata TaxID=151549 RepID=A0A4C1TE60_EUMVA|nr:hypothetical protein EVAR_77805_1 [Eumeta japonica]